MQRPTTGIKRGSVITDEKQDRQCAHISNLEERSCNRCCGRKAIRIKYYE